MRDGGGAAGTKKILKKKNNGQRQTIFGGSFVPIVKAQEDLEKRQADRTPTTGLSNSPLEGFVALWADEAGGEPVAVGPGVVREELGLHARAALGAPETFL